MARVTFLIALLLLVTTLSAPSVNSQKGPIGLLRSLIQDNLAGQKVVHEIQKWDFDPYIADRRRREFAAKNGKMGADLIESYGLGEDGHMEERRRQQKERDRAAGYF